MRKVWKIIFLKIVHYCSIFEINTIEKKFKGYISVTKPTNTYVKLKIIKRSGWEGAEILWKKAHRK